MRLTKLELHRFRRFEDASIDLDGRVLALVGPNEAGKTSLLTALQLLRSGGSIVRTDFTRNASTPAKAVVSGGFLLEESDFASINHIVEAAKSRWCHRHLYSDGTVEHEIVPSPLRDKRPRMSATRALSKVVAGGWFRALEPTDPIRDQIVNGSEILTRDSENLARGAIATIRELSETLSGRSDSPQYVREAGRKLGTEADHEAKEHPEDAAIAVLEQRMPEILLFRGEDRDLRDQYDLDASPWPAALENLAHLGGLDLNAVKNNLDAADRPAAAALIDRANAQLKAVFDESWSQSGVQVTLDLEGSLLLVYVPREGAGLSTIAERSDGFRWFVALIGFLERYAKGSRPILLVDEAETHLHYDAQADLVRVFERQSVVSQILYTTHSAGCLPSDLGAGVRAVAVSGPDRSSIHNSIWEGGTGYPALLMALGANAFALSAARSAVIGEGPTDHILIPTLAREARGVDRIDFQVVPGVAEVSQDQVAELGYAAVKVAWIVDGDESGRLHARKLKAGGVPPDRIVTLGKGRLPGVVVEDLLRPKVYVAAVNEELRRSGAGRSLTLRELPKVNRPAYVEKWCHRHRLKVPNKRAVAGRILDQRSETRLLDPRRAAVVSDLLRNVNRLLA